MPKEVIVCERRVFGPDSPATPLLETRFGRNGFVEFGLRTVHAADHSDYVPTEAEGSDRHPAGKPMPGSYVSLDRAQINELMRHLRRARDYAFGRDE